MTQFKTYRPSFYPALMILACALAQAGRAAPADGSDIVSFQVMRYGDTASLIKTPRGWITQRDSFPAKPEPIEEALKGIQALRAQSKPVPPAQAESDGSPPRRVEWTDSTGKTERADLIKTLFLDRFESDPSRIRIDTSANGHEYFWVVGDDSTLWRKPGSSQAWLAHGTFGWASARVIDWKDRTLSPSTYWEGVRSLTVDWKDDGGKRWHYKVERDASRTWMTEPRRSELDHENAQRILIPATQLAVDAFVDGPADSAWGLSDPSMLLRIRTTAGQETVLRVGRAVSGMRYVQHPLVANVVQVLDARFASLRKTPEEVIALLRVDTSDLKDTSSRVPLTPAVPHKHKHK